MGERQTRSSRHLQPSHNKKLDKMLNILIGIVIILIVITATYVFKWQDDAQETVKEEPAQEQKNDESEKEPSKEEDIASNDEQSQEEDQTKDKDQTKDEQQPEQNTAVETTSDDPIVDRVVTDENWKPTPTTQTGEHVSSYDDQSVDWAEKIATVTAITGITSDNMIVWRLQNNGGANKAIATVSTKDKSEKYRVSMEWVDNEGWLPVKLEQLNTLEGAY